MLPKFWIHEYRSHSLNSALLLYCQFYFLSSFEAYNKLLIPVFIPLNLSYNSLFLFSRVH